MLLLEVFDNLVGKQESSRITTRTLIFLYSPTLKNCRSF
jgi:hypothetical protein